MHDARNFLPSDSKVGKGGARVDPLEIYEVLKEKIIWLDLKPESTFNLTGLAESYGVSRNPITIALTRLDAEGWVVRHGSHFVVSPLSLKRIKEITEVRSALEVQASVWAMQRITPEELDSLIKLREEILGVRHLTSNREIVDLDVKFHQRVFQATKNNELAQLLERLLSHYLRFWLSIEHQIELPSFFTETLQVIEAIEKKDESKLREACARHIKASVDQILGTS
jgi:DNA-binding GntR family transcriptional regulator